MPLRATSVSSGETKAEDHRNNGAVPTEQPAALEHSPAPAASCPDAPEVLIREARRHRRKRWLWVSVVVLIAGTVTGIALGLSWGGGNPTSRAKSPASGPQVSVAPGFTLRSLRITGFSPEQVVSEAGRVWLIGPSDPGSFSNCEIESVDPTTLRTRRYPLAACGAYVTVGGGGIYLSAIAGVRGTNNELVQIERFDPATGQSVVMAPVVMTLEGSSEAHVAFAYADDSLWFRGSGTPGTSENDLVQISPRTGAVVRTITDGTWPLLNDQPLLLGNGDTLWVGAGVGTTPVIGTLAPNSAKPTQIYAESEPGGVQWMASVHGNVWADVADNGIPHLVEFSPSGSVLLRTGPQLIGDAAPASSDDTLWISGVVLTCNQPLRVWRVNGSTGRARATATVHTALNPCVAATGLATAGRFAFQLVGGAGSARLYRIGT